MLFRGREWLGFTGQLDDLVRANQIVSQIMTTGFLGLTLILTAFQPIKPKNPRELRPHFQGFGGQNTCFSLAHSQLATILTTTRQL